MNKSLVTRLALVVMALAVLASIPLDFVGAQFRWAYPYFAVETTDVFVGGLHLWPRLAGLGHSLTHAALVALAAATGLVVCWRHPEREDETVAFLTLGACLYAAVSRQPFVAEGTDELLLEARRALVAAYPLVCLAWARFFDRHVSETCAVALGVAAHLAAVMPCAWDGTGYAMAVSVPTLAWMALCWTIFAAPVHLGWLRTCGTRRRVALTALVVLAQTFALSARRVLEIVGSLSLPARPQPGYLTFNWATTHLDALAALPGSAYRDLVADPHLLCGLQEIPLAWLGVTAGPVFRLAYLAILTIFLVCVLIVWRCAEGAGQHAGLVRTLAAAVALSNLWGILCSVLSLTSTGVVTLVSGNPFQLVPIACLLTAGLMSTRKGRPRLRLV